MVRIFPVYGTVLLDSFFQQIIILARPLLKNDGGPQLWAAPQ